MKRLKLNLCCALASLALARSATAQLVITDAGTSAPTPQSADDVTNVFSSYQLNDGLNYWWNNSTPIGQTFTTGDDSHGYTLTSLAVKTAGGGGGGMLNSQTFTLRIFSIDGNGNATLMQTVTATGKLNAEGHWLQWTGLGVTLEPNAVYGYTFSGGTGYEELGNNGTGAYGGGEICLIPAAGGVVTYGTTHNSDAVFNIGLEVGAVAGGTAAISDIGGTGPTPGVYDISQLVGDAQNTYGLNYYWDSNPGQTFTTPNSSLPWVMTRLAVKCAGGGGGGSTSPQNFIIRLYSIANGNTASLIYSNAPAAAATLASENGEWLDCTGLSVVLQPNTQYAYTFSRGAGSGSWELMAARDGNPYAGGQICLIPAGGGTLSFGSQSGNSSSDAGFIVGLSSPTVYALLPAYSPDVNPIFAGTPVTLTETPVGIGPFSYQWQTDGGVGGSLTDIPGATSSNLVVDTTALLGTYSYAVTVSTPANGGASMTSPAAQLNITNASAPFIVTDITASPNSISNYVGNTQTFSVSINGTQPIEYQWFKASDAGGTGAIAVPGATNAALKLSHLQLSDAGYYSVVATNIISPFSTNSAWAQLDVRPASEMLFKWQTPVPFSGLSAGEILTNAVPNGSFLEAAYFGNAGTNIPVTLNGTTYTFFGDGSKVSVTGNSSATSGAYLTGTGSTTGNTNFDTVLDQFAYDGNSHTITLHNLLVGSNYFVQIFALDNRGPGLSRSTSFQDPNSAADISEVYGMSENKYLVGTFTAPSADVSITQNLLPSGQGNINAVVVGAVGWSAGTPASATQPLDVATYPGHKVIFSSTVNGIPAPTIQWSKSTDGGGTFVPVSDATNNSLVISNPTLANNGEKYAITVSNSFGTVQSAPATLTVLTTPPLSGIGSTNILALNPVAYWPLNEPQDPFLSSFGVPVYDASTNHLDGLYLKNAINWSYPNYGPQPADGFPQFVPGESGQGALGTFASDPNSYAIVPGLNLNTNRVTIMMWVFPYGAQNPNSGLLVDRDTTYGSAGGLCYDNTGTRLGYNWNNDSFTWSVQGPVIPENTWSFVALVVTPTNASLYVYNTNNGAAITTVAHNHANMSWGGTAAPDRLVQIGNDNSNSRIFNGNIDEVAVFNQSLTAEQLFPLVTSNPVITSQPHDQLVAAGRPVQFSVTVASATTVSYQWKTNGVDVMNGGAFSGVNTPTLSISSAGSDLNGVVFSVAVTNTDGFAVSSDARLSVVTPVDSNLYWDTNGIAAGAGQGAANGFWDGITPNWTSDSSGASATSLWINGENAVFSAGNDATNQFNVAVTNTGVAVNNLVQNNGRVRITGGPITLVNNLSTVTVNTHTTNGDYDLRIDADLTGAAAIEKEGPGILHLLGNKSFSGGITLNAGRLAFEPASDGQIVGLGTGPITLNGGEFVKNWNSITVTNPINVMGSVNAVAVYTSQSKNCVLSGPWLPGSTSGNFILTNTVAESLGVQSMTFIISGDISAYTGTFTHNCLSSGGNRLRFGDNTAGFVTINGANAKFYTEGSTTGPNGFDVGDGKYGYFNMGELAGTGGNIKAGWSTGGDTTFVVGFLNTSSTYEGVIKDNINGAGGRAALTKVGAGTLTLTATNAYTGLTTVSNGVLQINAPFLRTNASVSIASPGKLKLNFSGVDNIKSLIVDGVVMSNGTYGATGSGATTIDDAHFAGMGVLQVGSLVPAAAPLNYSFNSGVLQLSWPAGQGWTLQMQTNALSKGLGTNWTTLVSGASGISSTNIVIDPTKPTVFYRLVYP